MEKIIVTISDGKANDKERMINIYGLPPTAKIKADELNGNLRLNVIAYYPKDAKVEYAINPTETQSDVPQSLKTKITKFLHAWDNTEGNRNLYDSCNDLVEDIREFRRCGMEKIKKIVKELESKMQCNCDLDKWQPNTDTGHSSVCRIDKEARNRLKWG